MNTTARTWKQTLFTPVRELVGLPPLRHWKRCLAAAALPASAASLITAVIKHARLWRVEAADVADELIAHFHDGLDAGRSVDDLVKDFGDVKTAARLIRRAKMRNRPLLWRVSRRGVQVLAASVVLYGVAAAALTWSQPSPSVDYIASLTTRIDQSSPSDQGWPIYRQALLDEKCSIVNNKLFPEEMRPRNIERPARPGDPDWDKVVAHLARHERFLAAVRLGAAKAVLGMPTPSTGTTANFSDQDLRAIYGRVLRDGKVWQLATVEGGEDTLLSDNGGFDTNVSADADPDIADSMRHSVMAMLLPPLGFYRDLSILLITDMNHAVSTNDAGRAVSDYEAMLGMSRQVRLNGSHLIGQLQSTGMRYMANRALQAVLHGKPDIFSREQLVALAHASAKSAETETMDLACEKAFYLDLVQRIYSDDGAGDGHITRLGLKYLCELTPWPSYDEEQANLLHNDTKKKLLVSTALPAAVMFMPSRSEAVAEIEQIFTTEFKPVPLWEAIRVPSAKPTEQSTPLTITLENRHSFRAWLAALTGYEIASYSSSAIAIMQNHAFCEATSIAVSLEIFRRDQGHYPATLAEMGPHYLPTAPLDYSTNQPLLYTLRDNKPVLYGRGLDGKDDGGRPGLSRYGEVPTTGDWVLYPEPEPVTWQ